MNATRLLRFVTGYRLPSLLGLLNLAAMLVALYGFRQFVAMQEESSRRAREWSNHFEVAAALRETIVHLNPPARNPLPGEELVEVSKRFEGALKRYHRQRSQTNLPASLPDEKRVSLANRLYEMNSRVEVLIGEVQTIFNLIGRGSVQEANVLRAQVDVTLAQLRLSFAELNQYGRRVQHEQMGEQERAIKSRRQFNNLVLGSLTVVVIALAIMGTISGMAFTKLAGENEKNLAIASASEARFRALSESSPTGIMELDRTGKPVYWNERLKSMCGASVETLATGVSSIAHPEDKPRVEENWRNAVANGLSFSEIIRVVGDDGTLRWVVLRANPVRAEENSWNGFVVTVEDISVQKRAEAEIARARDAALASARLKSEFLANMSHEIRTPMNGVIGMTHLLLDTELNAQQRDFALTINSSAESLLGIINDILDFSKIESGKLEIEIGDFNLQEAVESVLDLLGAKATEKNLEFAAKVPSSLPVLVRGDAGRFRQVLLNLAANAIKFTPRGEVIIELSKVRTEGTTVRVRCEVRDTGIGIAESVQRRLFQSFEQADGSTARKYGGTGLGLAISRQLVGLMGGAIGCISAPAQGSVFWFELDLETQPLSNREEPAPEPKRVTGKILLVDDNATNRTILEHQVSSAGLACVVAENAAVALKTIQGVDPKEWTAAVLDMHMDDMNGLELAAALHSMPGFSHLPVLLLTSLGSTIPEADLTQAGISGYLHKPVKQSALLSAITRIVHQPKQVQRIEARSAGKSQLQSNQSLGSLRVLLAEDNTVNQRITVSQLAQLGVKIDVVANGKEAIEAVSRIPYTVILMDCQMPELDGYEATRQIRRGEKEGAFGADRARVTIIALTAHAMSGDRDKCLAAGMDDYVSKPVNPSELVRALSKAVGTALPNHSAAATSPNARQVVDLRRLRDVAADDPNEMQTLFNLFITQARASLAGLREAIDKNDAASVNRIAHKVAGSGAACGFDRVSDYYRQLEAISGGERDGSMSLMWQLCEQGLGEVEEEMARLTV